MINLPELFPALYCRCEHNDKGSVRFLHCDYPISISIAEYEFIYNLVRENYLHAGYEVATGTGLSSIAFAEALRDSNQFGYILTVDSYVEEAENSCNSYFGKSSVIRDSKGFNAIRTALNELGLREYVDLNIGRSPEDVGSIVESREAFDYVFIDAQHTTDALIADLTAIAPHILKDGFVLIHDAHCFDMETINGKCGELFGNVPRPAPNCGLDRRGYNLHYLKVKK